MKLDLFIPVYNEEKILEKHVRRLLDIFSINSDFRLVIVDDGSSDDTPLIAQGLKNSRIDYYRYNNPTRRENLAECMRNEAREDASVVGFIDCDFSTSPAYILGMLAFLSNYDIVIGNRYANRRIIKRNPARMFISFWFNFFWQVLGSEIQDGNCGLKFFKKPVYDSLYDKIGYDESNTRGWLWDRIILRQAEKDKHNIFQYPVAWTPGEKSSVSVKDFKLLLYFIRNPHVLI